MYKPNTKNKQIKSVYRTVAFLAMTSSLQLSAGPLEVARKYHDRLTGVIPSENVLSQMSKKIAEGKSKEAALIAIESKPFYNVALKTFFTPWTNESQTAVAPLNDYSATLIGAVRDEISFDRVLYDDIIYTLSYPGLPAYENNNNSHYDQFERTGASFRSYLRREKQSDVTGRSDAPGVMGTRQFGAEFYSMGTNRRAVRFTFINYMCHDMENLADTSRPAHRVRQDVTRQPGGDSDQFRNKCKGCHAGMDGLGGAFAYYNYNNNQVVYTPAQVQNKFLQNEVNFPRGYVTTDDSWQNFWISGVNQKLGWKGQSQGSGAAAYGRMLSQSEAFSGCMAQRVFEKVCVRSPVASEDKAKVKALANGFEKNKYNMKHLFADTAVACLSE